MGLSAWFIAHTANNNAGGLGEHFFATVFGEDTVYAPGYTEAQFVRVKLGADEAAVLLALGEPVSRSSRHGTSHWIYSRSPGSKNYRVRQVVMKDGKVAQKIASYYWD